MADEANAVPATSTHIKDNPYGTRVRSSDISETLSYLDDWESRYRFILELGRDLPPMPANLQTEARLLRGCQSQVWIEYAELDGRLWFMVDADAHIVRGLIAIVLAALNGRTPEALLQVDVDAYFGELELLKHLSQTRGNGLRALVARMRLIATQAVNAKSH